MKFLFVSAIVIAATSAHRLRKCDRDIDLVFLKDYYVNPQSFGPGHHVKLHIDLENNYMPINDGFIQYVLMHNHQEYYPQVDSLCSMISCPIRMGDNKITIPIEIPVYEEDIGMRIQLHNRNMTSFACVKLNLKTTIWSKFISWITSAPVEPIAGFGVHNLRGSDETIIPSATPRQDKDLYNASFIDYLNKVPPPPPLPHLTPGPIPHQPSQQSLSVTLEVSKA